MSDGPTYLVHRPDGTTFGPADVSMLREWVAAGIVTKTTALSLQGDDRKTPAAVVPGLFEPKPVSHSTVKSADPMYQAHLASGTTDALSLADLSRMVEAGDVASTTPISLVGGSKRVPAAVVPGLEVAFRRSAESERLDWNSGSDPLGESHPECDLLAEEAQHEQVGPTTVHEANSVALVAPTPSSGDSSGTSARGLNVFLVWCLASTLISLVVCMCILGYLTKVEFPTFGSFGDKGWKGDVIEDGVKESVSHGWRGAVWALVVGLVILVAVLVQRWGANPWSCFLLPAIWFGFGTSAVWGKESHDRESCKWGGICIGIWLGYWYAAILSVAFFGLHPLSR